MVICYCTLAGFIGFERKNKNVNLFYWIQIWIMLNIMGNALDQLIYYLEFGEFET